MSKKLGKNSYSCYCMEKYGLTLREFEVLIQLAKGQNNAEIANELCITVHTVKAYVAKILHKLSVKDRVQVVIKVLSEKLLDS